MALLHRAPGLCIASRPDDGQLTDTDPQSRKDIVAALQAAGVLVASSNAEAAAWSAMVIAERRKVMS
jgi:hypothetical protein